MKYLYRRDGDRIVAEFRERMDAALRGEFVDRVFARMMTEGKDVFTLRRLFREEYAPIEARERARADQAFAQYTVEVTRE